MKTLVITLTIGGSIFLTGKAMGQAPSPTDLKESKWLDSLETAGKEQRQIQKTADAKTLSDLKDEKSDSKLNAQEAQRVETDASNSAKASKSAYKTEKKAQKARRRADAQAKKASQAKEKSDNN